VHSSVRIDFAEPENDCTVGTASPVALTGEGKDMVSETPPPSVIMFGLGLRSDHHPSLDQLISSQLNQIDIPLLSGAGRAGRGVEMCGF
jgi:hypothetical protein